MVESMVLNAHDVTGIVLRYGSFYGLGTSLSVGDVKILITLSYRVGWGSSSDQVMAQYLGKVGILAAVLGFELVGADFGVGASHVAWSDKKRRFTSKERGTETVLLTESASGKGFSSRILRKCFRISLGQDGDGVRVEFLATGGF